MANIRALQSGNFSDTSTWVGGVVPVAGDNIIVPNGITVNLDSYSGPNIINPYVVPQPATVLMGVAYGESSIGTLNVLGGETTNTYQSARYWRIYMTTNNGDTYYSLQEVQIIGPDGVMVMTSPTTTVDASSFYDGGTYQADASKLVDGDENNGELGVWVSSGSSATEWVSFDFVFPVGVSKLRILPQAYAPVSLSRSPNNYEIQWSDDNTNWTTIKSITGDTSWTFDTYNVIELDPTSVQPVSISEQLDRIEDKVNGIPPISLNVEAIKTQTDKFFFEEVTEQKATGDIHWDDTVLLIHGNDGTIADEKTHTITNTSVSSTTTQAMNAGGSSMEFNQTNSLSIQHADYVLGTGDFTVEFWIYRDQLSQVYGSFFSNGYYGSYGGFNIRQSGGAEQIEVVTGWSNVVLSPTISTPLNEWIHIALTRETGLMRIFINGQFGGSIAASDNYTHDTLYVGTDGSYYASFSNIVDLRVTKVCRYNAPFTPPESLTHAPGTQPVIETHVKALTSSAGTGTNYDADFLEINNKLDLLATNISEIEVIANKFSFTPVYKPEDPFLSGVAFIENYDSESIGSVYGFSPTIVSGVPYTTTLQKRLGARSLACDGNVIINYGNITAMDVGANDFTIEFSAYFKNTLAGNPTAFGGIMGKRENTNFSWTIYVSNGHLTFLTSAGAQPYSFTHSLELTQFQWADVALSRTGNTLKFYINGQMESAEVPGMELNNVSSTFIIGALNVDTLDHFFHGYLDRIRFTAGTGRYNTVAPTSPPVEYSITPIGTNEIDYYKVNSNPGEVDTTTIDRIEDRVLDLKARLRAIHFIME